MSRRAISLLFLCAAAAGISAPAAGVQARPHAAAFSNSCSFVGGGPLNSPGATSISACFPGMKFFGGAAARDLPLQIHDNSYLHEFTFDSPLTRSWQIKICSSDLIDFSVWGLSGQRFYVRSHGRVGHDCVSERVVRIHGPFALTVHTEGANSKIELHTRLLGSLDRHPARY